MSHPKPETFPTAGGTYVQQPDGRLERVEDAAAAAPVEGESESATQKVASTSSSRSKRASTPE